MLRKLSLTISQASSTTPSLVTAGSDPNSAVSSPSSSLQNSGGCEEGWTRTEEEEENSIAMEEEGEETKRPNDRAPPRAPIRAFSAQLIELRLKLDRIGDFGVRGGGSEDSESVVVLLSNKTLIFFQPKMIYFFPSSAGV